MFQDFQLSITCLKTNHYLLKTETVPEGVPFATEEVQWDVDAWIENIDQLRRTNQLLWGRRDAAVDDPSAVSQLNEFSQTLYKALFFGKIKDSWYQSLTVTHQRHQTLRFHLGLSDDRLHKLPWEMAILDASRLEWPSLLERVQISFSRYCHPDQSPPLPSSLAQVNTVAQPLKIVMILASSDDQHWLPLRQAIQQLEQQWQESLTSGTFAIDWTILECPQPSVLVDTIARERPQIVHYVGQDLCLSLFTDIAASASSRDLGLTDATKPEDAVATLLADSGVQCALFINGGEASPFSTSSGENVSEQSFAQSLALHGIPAVFVLSGSISQALISTLVHCFYRNLYQGYPVDMCIEQVRQCLASAPQGTGQEGIKANLYLHPQFQGRWHRGLQQQQSDELLSTEADQDFLELPSFLDAEDEFYRTEADSVVFQGEASLDVDDDVSFIKELLSQKQAEDSNTPKLSKETIQAKPIKTEKSSQLPPQANKLRRYSLPLAFGAMLAIALGSLLFWQQSRQTTVDVIDSSVISVSEPPDLTVLDNTMLTSFATDQAQQGNWQTANQAVSQLLDRRAMPQAKTVLFENIAANDFNKAELNFLQGRFAWQTALQSDNITENGFEVTDARRYWEMAHRYNPQSATYLNALGFAYYAEGRHTEANQAWYNALEAAESNPDSAIQQSQIYAGLALSIYQIAQHHTGEQQAMLEQKAIKLREIALVADPSQLQSAQLEQNWLWSAAAIADWQAVLALQ